MRYTRVLVALMFAVPQVALAQGQAAALLPGGNSKDPVSINAGKLDYLSKEQKLIYSGGVLARQGKSTLKASSLTIFLTQAPGGNGASVGPAPTGNSVQRMEADGPVTVTSGQEVGTGAHATYEKAANRVVVTGHVTLTQGPNVTRGDVLTYNLTSGQAVVSGHVQSLFTPASSPRTSHKKH